MSRLDSFIRRLEAQRACLDHLADCISSLDGIILELGLGNGRTYDHIRSRCPGREIFVFEREVRAHPDCIPDADHLVIGDMAATLPSFLAEAGRRVALAHADIGSGEESHNRAMSALLSATLPDAMVVGGMIACDQRLSADGLVALPLPDGVPADRYFLYRKTA